MHHNTLKASVSLTLVWNVLIPGILFCKILNNIVDIFMLLYVCTDYVMDDEMGTVAEISGHLLMIHRNQTRRDVVPNGFIFKEF